MAANKEKEQQQARADATFKSADFRAALATKFEQAGTTTKGLLAPQLKKLEKAVVDLEAQFRKDYAKKKALNPEAITIIEDKLASFLKNLLAKVNTTLEGLILEQEENPNKAELEKINSVFSEHHTSLAKLVSNLETKIPDMMELTMKVDESFQRLVKNLRTVKALLGKFKDTDDSLVEKTAREERVARLTDKISVADQIVDQISSKIAGTKTFDFTKPYDLTWNENEAGKSKAVKKTFPTVYLAIAEKVLKLTNDPDLLKLNQVASGKKVSQADSADEIAAADMKKILDAVLEKAYGVDKKSGLAREVFDKDKTVAALADAKKAFAGISPDDFDGSKDYATELAALKTAKSKFDALVFPSGAEDPDQLFMGFKNEMGDDVQTLVDQVETNQWLISIETTYPKLKTLKDTYKPILDGTIVYPDKVTEIRKIRNDLENRINEARTETEAGAALNADKTAKLNALYFDKAQRALDIVIREQTRRVEEDQDYMNMSPAKLADIINGFGGFGLEIEHTAPTGADPSEVALREAYHNRFFLLRLARFPGAEDPATRLKTLTATEMELLQAKLDVSFTRLDNKMNASNAIPEGNRGDMSSELFSSLSLEKDEVIHGLTAHPVYGQMFNEMTQRMIWAIGLKDGWQVNQTGKIERAGASANPRVSYNKEYDYGSGICASGGKVRLMALINETFDNLIAEATAAADPKLPELRAKRDYLVPMAYHYYMGLNLLDNSLALRQRIGDQTKSHDAKTAKNYAVANTPFDDLNHKINRYEKGFELSSAIYLMFYPELEKADLLDRGLATDKRSEDKFLKLKLWRELLIQYFEITGSSLKGVIPELDPPVTFPRPGHPEDMVYAKKYTKVSPAGVATPVEIGPIGVPQWGDEVFPSVHTVLTKFEYRDHQVWDQYYKAEASWMKFMDTIAEPVPANVTIDKIMGTKNDGLLTQLVESPVLGMAKLVKGNHYNYVAPMLTFYIQELMANLSPGTKEEKARALKRIVQKLDNVSKSGLDAMYPQIQKVIMNLQGDRGFRRNIDGEVVEFDSEFIPDDDYDLVTPILGYEYACEEFINEEFNVHSRRHPDLKQSIISGKPVVRARRMFESPDRRARLEKEAHHLQGGEITRPYGVSLAPSKEKTTEDEK